MAEADWVFIGYTDDSQIAVDASPRAGVLDEAKKLITGDRNNQYGPPTQDFDRTAAALNGLGYRLNDKPLKGSDVAIIMATLKLSRLIWQRDKRDSWVDLAGYAGCGFECAEGEE